MRSTRSTKDRGVHTTTLNGMVKKGLVKWLNKNIVACFNPNKKERKKAQSCFFGFVLFLENVFCRPGCS